MGRGISGLFHLKYSTPDTDTIMKNDSTMLLYVISTYTSGMQTIISDKMHRKTNDGVGVYLSMLMWDKIVGMCPLRAPTKHIRDDVIMCTDKPPNADIATNTGMIH